MKKYVTLMAVLMFGLVSQLASAGTMTCGSYIIEDDQVNGQSRTEIEEKCGTPDSSSGNNLLYKQDNVMYRLHFNDNDELESITEEME